ncbi:MAG: acetamidase/formamidase family protein [Candidatus Atribacteria bacterium]|nr:acetamidase/formamidase family protein [Candidatus Atribacteria bacterium]
MKIVDKDKFINIHSKDNSPAITIEPKEDIILTVLGGAGNQLDMEKLGVQKLDLNTFNDDISLPSAGPVAVTGSLPGDSLSLEIKDISFDKTGWIAYWPGIHKIPIPIELKKEPYSYIVPIRDNMIIFSDEISIPVKPMIGAIGITPADYTFQTTEASSIYGGNMDIKDITIGSIIYLPVFIPGGLFSLGDLHASMGDGEVGGSGVECGGKVRLRVDLIKNARLFGPIVETSESWCTVGVNKSFEKAAEIAIRTAIELIHKETGWERDKISMLISCVADLKICQMVGRSISVRLAISKDIVSLKLFSREIE